jgi:hypothetical protein
MKHTRLYVVLFVVLGVAAYFILNKYALNSTLEGGESNFAVTDTDEIYKIFIADKQGKTATLERNNDTWEYVSKTGKRYKVRPAAIKVLLETMQKVQVRYVVPQTAMKLAVEDLAVSGKKVELYNKKGKRFKTYYVGGPSNDSQGTFMIMEGSKQPYVTHLPYWEGFLTDRYLLEEKDWRDKTVFGYKSKEIKSIQVDYPSQQANSFLLTQVKNGKFTVAPLYPGTPTTDKPILHQKALAYLYNFERLIAEAYETQNPNKGYFLEKIPFIIVEVKLNNGDRKRVRFIPIIEEVDSDLDGSHEYRPDVERYFAFVDGTEGEDAVLVQHLVFKKIFWGYNFFFEK